MGCGTIVAQGQISTGYVLGVILQDIVCLESRSYFENLPRWRSGALMDKRLLAVGFLEVPIELFVDNMGNRI